MSINLDFYEENLIKKRKGIWRIIIQISFLIQRLEDLIMNFRQWKKKVYHKRVEHGFWKKYKKEMRKFWANSSCKNTKKKRLRQIAKCSQ